MLTNLKMNNICSIKNLDMNIKKGRYTYKEDMIYKNIVNPIGIYGHNGTGKSTIIRAMKDLLELLIGDSQGIKAFCPNLMTSNSTESFIELEFDLKNRKYNYYIKTEFTNNKIVEEKLFCNTELIFDRKETIISNDKQYVANSDIYCALRQLYNDSYDIKEEYKLYIKEVYEYLSNMVIVRGSWGELDSYYSKISNYKSMSDLMVENSDKVKEVLATWKEFPIYDLVKIKNENTSAVQYYSKFSIGENGAKLLLPTFMMSNGMIATSKLLSILVNLKEESLVFIDEIEKNLHPEAILNLIEELQKRKIQVIFSSHNTNILQYLRPDQIYFAKWKDGISRYSRLSNIYDNIREINNIEKMYLSSTFDEFME